MNEKAQVKEQIKEQEDVKTALKQTAGTKESMPKPVPELKDKLWFGTYIFALIGLLAFYYVLGSDLIPTEIQYISTLRSVLLGAVFVVLTVAIAKSIQVYWISQIDSRPARYNLTRVLNLLTFLAIVIIGLSLLSANWYTALVSLGVLSLILGFALQTPITSLIGWVYLLIRQPYKVGDRIQIGDARGDVIDVSYLDTTLWEFGGEHLWTDHPSGRVIKFPNATVFDTPVFNYSWPLFPYVWNEIKFQLAYESDLEFVAKTMKDVVDEQIGDIMSQKVKVYKGILSKTPVDELEVKEHPVVHFRVSENTWLEAIVRYLVPPKEAGRTKTRLIKEMLAQLNARPDRVLFPKSNLR